MCGIAGVLESEPSGDRRRLHGVLEAMAASLVHRGPDAGGVWADAQAGIGLAHRRLAIVDLSPAGAQPMRSASGRFHIVFNGEIYNFQLLADELRRGGAVFRGHSDTEVLLAAVERWGVRGALDRASGMFAFALWDSVERVLHLARDRLGEKPLYYGMLGSNLVFGSELKALRTHPAWRGGVDRRALTLLLRYGYVPAPYSIHDAVYKLPPGTLLSVPAARLARLTLRPEPGAAAGDELRPQVYWSARQVAEAGLAQPWRDRPEAAVDALDDLLRGVVRQQMISDVPLGAFLSGGIDSSTVVALMQAESALPVRTFTIGFGERDYDEAGHAKAVARHLGTDHSELYVSPEQALALIPRLPTLYDEPFADPSQIPTFLVSQLARRHVTVALSGDGGDELFAGYNRYFQTERIWRREGRLPRPARELLAGGLTALTPRQWERMAGLLRSGLPFVTALRQANLGGKLHKLAMALRARDSTELYRQLVSYWPQPTAAVPGAVEPQGPIAADNRLAGAAGLSDDFMYWDQVSYLPGDNLVKVDRASMGVSLEVRLPLLDHRVVEFAWRIPLALKIREDRGKWLLRQLLYRYVPPELIDRPKMGFSVPVAAWLRGPLREWAEELLNESRLRADGLLDPAPIRAYWRAHLAGEDRSLPLWTVLMFQAWREQQAASGARVAKVA